MAVVAESKNSRLFTVKNKMPVTVTGILLLIKLMTQHHE